jgi:hypothetical protein
MAGTPDDRKLESHRLSDASGGENSGRVPGLPGSPVPLQPVPRPDDAHPGSASADDEGDWEAELAALSASEAADEYSHLIEDYSHLAPP